MSPPDQAAHHPLCGLHGGWPCSCRRLEAIAQAQGASAASGATTSAGTGSSWEPRVGDRVRVVGGAWPDLLGKTAKVGKVYRGRALAGDRVLAIWPEHDPTVSVSLSEDDVEPVTSGSRESPHPCRVPPPGWSCSRAGGHEGPCAASAITAGEARSAGQATGTPCSESSRGSSSASGGSPAHHSPSASPTAAAARCVAGGAETVAVATTAKSIAGASITQTSTSSSSEPSPASGLDSDRSRARAIVQTWWSQDFQDDVAQEIVLSLSEVRRETIEACAKVCDERAAKYDGPAGISAEWCAKLIRDLPFTSDTAKEGA